MKQEFPNSLFKEARKRRKHSSKNTSVIQPDIKEEIKNYLLDKDVSQSIEDLTIPYKLRKEYREKKDMKMKNKYTPNTNENVVRSFIASNTEFNTVTPNTKKQKKLSKYNKHILSSNEKYEAWLYNGSDKPSPNTFSNKNKDLDKIEVTPNVFSILTNNQKKHTKHEVQRTLYS